MAEGFCLFDGVGLSVAVMVSQHRSASQWRDAVWRHRPGLVVTVAVALAGEDWLVCEVIVAVTVGNPVIPKHPLYSRRSN
jgi:hypothetical protein